MTDAGKRARPGRRTRGDPKETRARLIRAAGKEFNRHGYHGTDSNRIARAAGYAPGTFYKHFRHKLAAFLAVYEDWVTREWTAIGRRLARGGEPSQVAADLVSGTLRLHRRWRGFRSSLHALVTADARVRSFHRAQRLRQLQWMEELRRARAVGPGVREQDALLLFLLERTCDAIARGEARDLGLSLRELERRLVRNLTAHLSGGAAPIV